MQLGGAEIGRRGWNELEDSRALARMAESGTGAIKKGREDGLKISKISQLMRET